MLDILIDQVKLLDLESGKESFQQVGIEGNRIRTILPEKAIQPQARKVIHGNGEPICFLDSLISILTCSSTAADLDWMQIAC